MKIAIVICLFPPKWLAGTEIATYNIAKHLSKRGHEVHIMTSLDEGLPKESAEHGIYIHRIGWRKARFVGVLIFWTKIIRILRNIRPDIIHIQGISMGMPGLMAKVILKKPILVWGRGTDVYHPNLIMSILSKQIICYADIVVALSEDMKKEMQKTCMRNITVIPNGINLDRYENICKDMVREKLHFKTCEKLILFIGSLRTEKGLKYLIDAMDLIRGKNRSCRLIIVGEGSEERILKKMVKNLNLSNYVYFIGQIPNEMVPCYMAASDVFVLPSLYEGLPNVILEAMASGLPIVATKVGALPEILIDGVNGFLIEPENSRQIYEKVSLLLEDQELRVIISKNNRENAKKYSWDNIIKKIEDAYQNCL
jgi:glycosyltransferase involved in cell wall biosynthesis